MTGMEMRNFSGESGVKFVRVHMESVDLTNAVLVRANFQEAHLNLVTFAR
eukprot:CAMPEP_0119335682 /NCGR_PEP_ID=MMETSP1333-20130426/90079_1 /TAXON_ID=418940 /ORGANISM="Scyphosphaera apsteinii, Strain RCC1455" /LENGTH=49 /DNA_ID= /DNA_START= /DNA_END= /DNA_ORIENTATION=